MKKYLGFIPLIAIVGAICWGMLRLSQTFNAEHLNGSPTRLECSSGADGSPATCVLHVEMPRIYTYPKIRCLELQARRDGTTVDTTLQYLGLDDLHNNWDQATPYRWKYQGSPSQTITKVSLEEQGNVLAIANVSS